MSKIKNTALTVFLKFNYFVKYNLIKFSIPPTSHNLKPTRAATITAIAKTMKRPFIQPLINVFFSKGVLKQINAINALINGRQIEKIIPITLLSPSTFLAIVLLERSLYKGSPHSGHLITLPLKTFPHLWQNFNLQYGHSVALVGISLPHSLQNISNFSFCNTNILYSLY